MGEINIEFNLQASADINENENSQPNVSTCDDLLINKYAIENVTACASANDNALNEIESFACDPGKTTLAMPEIRFEFTDADISERNDLTAIADDDGKIQEFMDYIQNLDRKQSGDRLGFREFPSDSQRQRYPSYNYDARDDEELNINILAPDIVEPFDDNEENSPHSKNSSQLFLNSEKNAEVKNRHPLAVKRTLSLQIAATDIDKSSNTLSPNLRNFRRKSSLTDSLDSTTNSNSLSFINELKFEHRPMQRIQKVDNFQSIVQSPPLISKSFSPYGSQASIAEIEFVFIENTDLHDLSTNEKKPPISRSTSYSGGQTIDSSSLENVIERKQSLNSTDSNPSSIKNFEQIPHIRSSSSLFCGREGSWTSVDSHTRYERSQSRYSDLEFINGRDDWRAVTGLHLDQQIDSDNYHHHRRYSETSSDLEYIRGRDDWIRYEEDRERCSTLPRSSSRYGIIDEIDADEYHHHRCLSEIISYTTKVSNNVFLAQGSARSGRDRSPYKVLRTDINKTEFIERYIWNGDETPDITYSHTDDSEKDGQLYGDKVQSERYIWIADNTKTRSQSPFTITIGENADGKTDDRNTGSGGGASNPNVIDVSVASDDNYKEPSVEIPKIIEHNNDPNERIDIYTDVIQTSADESIEVVVVNLNEESSEQEFDEPIFVISEMDDCAISSSILKDFVILENRESEEKNIDQFVEPTTIGEIISSPALKEQENQLADNLLADELCSKNRHTDKEPNRACPTSETKIEETIGKENENRITTQRAPLPIATASETNAKETTARKKPSNSQQKPNKSIRKDDLEDLIVEGSLGPWFHK